MLVPPATDGDLQQGIVGEPVLRSGRVEHGLEQGVGPPELAPEVLDGDGPQVVFWQGVGRRDPLGASEENDHSDRGVGQEEQELQRAAQDVTERADRSR